MYLSLRLLTDGQHGPPAGDDPLQAMAVLSQPPDVVDGVADGVLRDQIVDLRWVMHQAVSESHRLQERLDAQEAELKAMREVARTLAEECERALAQRRTELSSPAGMDAALPATKVGTRVGRAQGPEASSAVGAHVEAPRGAVALLLRLLLPPSVYGGLRDALGSRRR